MPSDGSPPSLMIAQVLADLNDLGLADPGATASLLNASNTLKGNHYFRSRSSTDMSGFSPFTPPALRTRESSSYTQSSRTPISRQESSRQSSSTEAFMSPVATPSMPSADPDMQRARELMTLSEMRGRIADTEMGMLKRARVGVNAVAERYAARTREMQREDEIRSIEKERELREEQDWRE